MITCRLGSGRSEDSWEVLRNINARESVWLVWTELLAHSSAAERRRGLGSVLVCPCFALLLEKTGQS